MAGGYKPRLHDNDVAWLDDKEWKIGTIYDKYQGTRIMRTTIGDGNGTTSVSNPITVDYYVIRELGKTISHHVLCSNVYVYNKSVHKNEDKKGSVKNISSEEALG